MFALFEEGGWHTGLIAVKHLQDWELGTSQKAPNAYTGNTRIQNYIPLGCRVGEQAGTQGLERPARFIPCLGTVRRTLHPFAVAYAEDVIL